MTEADDMKARAARFSALHERPGVFVMANAWDPGSARLLTSLGFEALATSSAGFAFSRGLPDGAMTLDAVLAHCGELCCATTLPVSADLEDCFAADPRGVGETVARAAQTGLAGASIEDWWAGRDGSEPRMMDIAEASERVSAAVAAARATGRAFTLTARAENLLRGGRDLDDTIARLLAYQDAGADVLYAPALGTVDAVRTVLEAVERPVNVLMGGGGPPLSVAELEALGVRRISLGSAFARAAYGELLNAGREILETGTFAFVPRAASFATIERMLKDAAGQ